MVDLRAELRPFVDEPTRPPLPMTEVAARARRRRQRKRAAGAAGIAAAFVGSVGLVVALVARGPGDRVTTADEPDRAPAPSAPTTTPAPTTAAPSPTTSVPPPVSATDAAPEADGGLVASPGVTATATTTSSWEDGSCVEVRLTNTTAAAVDWEVLAAPAGRITTVWNATTQGAADGRTAFHGEAWNGSLQPGLDTTFGYCIET